MQLDKSHLSPGEYAKRPDVENLESKVGRECLELDSVIETSNGRRLPHQRLAEIFSNPDRYDALVLTHNDLDGETAGTLVAEFLYDTAMVVPLPRDRGDTDWVAKFLQSASDDTPVWIVDHGPDESTLDEWVRIVDDVPNPVHIRDHHEHFSRLDDVADYHHHPDKCAAEIVADHDIGNLPEAIRRLVDHVSVYDLWKSDDERFERAEVLSQANYALPHETFCRLAIEYGLDMLDESEEADRIHEVNYLDYAKATWILNNYHKTVNISGYRVAFAYGNGSSSAISHHLFEATDTDILVHGYPYPEPKVSIRTRDDLPFSHLIAREHGGGGHEHSAASSGAEAPEYASESFDEYADIDHDEKFVLYRTVAGDVIVHLAKRGELS